MTYCLFGLSVLGMRLPFVGFLFLWLRNHQFDDFFFLRQ